MQWFKFYGQDFITDPKMGFLTTPQRLLWVYLLSMASQTGKKDGVLKWVTLNHLRALAGITENDENWRMTENTLETFEEMGLVTISNEIVTICNYQKHQELALTGAERQAKYRSKVTGSNEIVTKVSSHSDARIDKNRIDKNTYVKEINKEKDSTSLVTLSTEKPFKKNNTHSKAEAVIKTSKNSLTPCTPDELKDVANELGIELKHVKITHDTILDKIEAGEFKYKTVYYTLKNWLRLSVQKGHIKQDSHLIVQKDPRLLEIRKTYANN